MTLKNVFSYDDYRNYLRDLVAVKGEKSRGFWTEIARATGCQSSYVSRILAGSAHFSQEQTLRLCEHLLLSNHETEYFLGLVERQKAGTRELRNYYQKKLEAMRERNLNIEGRVKPSVTLAPEALATFYSQWYYLAIHVLLLNPNYRSTPSLAAALGLPLVTVEKVVRFLLEQKLAQTKDGELVTGEVHTHLGAESPFIKQHHSNWRIAAIESIRGENERDLHYSGVSSLSEEAVHSLRERMVAFIEDYVRTIKPTRDETLYAFNLDFFKLLRSK